MPSITTTLNGLDTSEVIDENKIDQNSYVIDTDKSLLECNDTVSSSSGPSVLINSNKIIPRLEVEKDEKLSNTTENYALHGQEITSKQQVKDKSYQKEENIVALALDDTSTLAIHVPKDTDEEKEVLM